MKTCSFSKRQFDCIVRNQLNRLETSVQSVVSLNNDFDNTPISNIASSPEISP